MVYRCCVCETSSARQPVISFHSFPKDPERRRAWMLACNLDDDTFKPHMRVCSKHFLIDDFDAFIWPRIILLKSAIPAPSRDWPLIKKRPNKAKTTVVPTWCASVASISIPSMEIHTVAATLKPLVETPSKVQGEVKLQETSDFAPITMGIPENVCLDARFIGYLEAPWKAKRYLQFLHNNVDRYRRKVKNLQIAKRRFQACVNSLLQREKKCINKKRIK